MQEIPLEKVPNQQFEVILNNQNCTIKLYQRADKMYMDLEVDDVPVFYGSICEDKNIIMQYENNLFKGNLIFVDILASSDPNYSELSTRYKLLYIEESELI